MKGRIRKLPGKLKAPLFTKRQDLSLKFAIWSLISSSLSIWSILWITTVTGHSLLIGSFGATAVLLFAAPEGPMSQPRNLVGGHLISSIVAVVLVASLGSSFFSIGLAVGLSIFIMYLTHTLHPPGGATALIGVTAGVDYEFIFIPVLLGVLILLVNAILVNNFVHHRKYPKVWF